MELAIPPTELFNQHTCAALNSLFLALCTIFIPNSFKKGGWGGEILRPWKANGGEVPSFRMFQHVSRFTAADVKAKFNIPELTQPELPSQMSSDPPSPHPTPLPQVDKWMNASKRSNLCEKLHLYKLERLGAAEETKQTFSQTAGLSRDEKGGPGL